MPLPDARGNGHPDVLEVKRRVRQSDGVEQWSKSLHPGLGSGVDGFGGGEMVASNNNSHRSKEQPQNNGIPKVSGGVGFRLGESGVISI